MRKGLTLMSECEEALPPEAFLLYCMNAITLKKVKEVKALAEYGSPLAGSFVWSQTYEGHDYWERIDRKYFSLKRNQTHQ